MNINPKQMQQAMKRLGMKQEEINATEVIIKTPDKILHIANPNVQKIIMMGDTSFQISGTITEQATTVMITEDDITTVMQQANTTHEKAKQALHEHHGDLAAAILDLSQ